MSPRITFEKELSLLRDNVTDMAEYVEQNYEILFQAYKKKENEEVEKVIQIEKEISKRQREIESECLFLITKQQPIVGDLRMVTASLKVIVDIQRIGAHIVDISELMLRIKLKEFEKYSLHLAPMIQAVKKMVNTAVKAFTKREMEIAAEVIAYDDVVDDCFNQVKEDLVELLKKEAQDADECVDILMIAKYLEKIGDHAVNIAEWEIFQETGNMNNTRIL